MTFTLVYAKTFSFTWAPHLNARAGDFWDLRVLVIAMQVDCHKRQRGRMS